MPFERTQVGLTLTNSHDCASSGQFTEFHAGKDHFDFLVFDSENISIRPHLKQYSLAVTHFINLTGPFTVLNCSFLRAVGRLG